MEFVQADPKYAEVYYSWRNDPVSVSLNPFLNLSLEGVKEQLAKDRCSFDRMEGGRTYRWFALVDETPVGQVSVQDTNLMMQTLEIGYQVAPDYRGRGIGTRMVRKLIDEIFVHSNIRKVGALINEKNAPSRRIVEKLGFQQEGFLREHYLIGGKPVNEIYYAVLRREWEAVNSKLPPKTMIGTM